MWRRESSSLTLLRVAAFGVFVVRHGESRLAGKSSKFRLQSNVTSCDGDNLYYRGIISTSKMGGGAFLFPFLSLPFLVVLGTEQRSSCMLCRAHALPLGCTPVPELVETFQARVIPQALSWVTLSSQGTLEGPMRAKPGTFRVASSPKVGLKWPVRKSGQ